MYAVLSSLYFFIVFKLFSDVQLKADICLLRDNIYIRKMAAHFPISCDALIWHSATLLLPATHMAPLTFHPPSDPAWELLLHELWDMHGCWRTQMAFCSALPDRPNFPFLCQIPHYCLFLSSPSLPSTFSTFLPVVIPTVASAWAWQIGSPGAHLVCSAAVEASASISDLLWPCHGLCGTKNPFPICKETNSKRKIISKLKMKA